MGTLDDDDLVDGRGSEPLEDAREEELLLGRVAEARRRAGREHDGGDGH